VKRRKNSIELNLYSFTVLNISSLPVEKKPLLKKDIKENKVVY